MEKTIIKSETYNPIIVIGVLIALSLCIPIFYIILFSIIFDDYTMRDFLHSDGAAFIPKLLAPIFFIVSLWAIFFTEMAVTDKRVFGKTMFGKRVDLPLDSISAVGFSGFHGISVGTSSGRISFALIRNNKEIHKCINDLLIERQQENSHSTTTIIQNSDEADQLKKYKDLLDSGVITQEEFDQKKKQLLGL